VCLLPDILPQISRTLDQSLWIFNVFRQHDFTKPNGCALENGAANTEHLEESSLARTDITTVTKYTLHY
jgi:hypothetical protein